MVRLEKKFRLQESKALSPEGLIRSITGEQGACAHRGRPRSLEFTMHV
jgi:hypothetical protein